MFNFFNSLQLTWRAWLCLYTLPGLAIAVYSFVKSYKERPSEFARNILKAMGRETSVRQHLENILVYSIAGTCILLGWPIYLVWWVVESKREAARLVEQNKSDFDCAPEYLIKQLSPSEAESTSYIVDPLRKTPDVPFGHLNQAWGLFLCDMLDPRDELWSFFIPQDKPTGKWGNAHSGDISGFAKVQDGKILGEFITEGD